MRIVTVAAAALAVSAVAFGTLAPAQTGSISTQILVNLPDYMPQHGSRALGGWNYFCEPGQPSLEFRSEGFDGLGQGGCHLSYVDVFDLGNESSDQGVIAALVSTQSGQLRVEFGIDPDISFEHREFHLYRSGFPVWKLEKSDCASHSVCTFTGPAASALVDAFSDKSAKSLEFQMKFVDNFGKRHKRTWQMKPQAQVNSAPHDTYTTPIM